MVIENRSFLAYCMLKPYEGIRLVENGCNLEEIYSALYGEYQNEKKKYQKSIKSIKHMFEEMLTKLKKTRLKKW